MNKKWIYLVLTIIWWVVPYIYFWKFLYANGLDFALFFQELFSTNIWAFFWLDVIISAFVLFAFMFHEKNIFTNKKILLIPIITTLTIWVSFSFPLFLYLREIALEKNNS